MDRPRKLWIRSPLTFFKNLTSESGAHSRSSHNWSVAVAFSNESSFDLYFIHRCKKEIKWKMWPPYTNTWVIFTFHRNTSEAKRTSVKPLLSKNLCLDQCLTSHRYWAKDNQQKCPFARNNRWSRAITHRWEGPSSICWSSFSRWPPGSISMAFG